MRQSGIRGLYKGLPVLLLGSVPKTAVRFSANAQANQRLQSLFPQFCNQNKVAKSLLAGLIAGVSEAILIVCPMETVKVRFINDFNRGQCFSVTLLNLVTNYSTTSIPKSLSRMWPHHQARRPRRPLQGADGDRVKTGHKSNDAIRRLRELLVLTLSLASRVDTATSVYGSLRWFSRRHLCRGEYAVGCD